MRWFAFLVAILALGCTQSVTTAESSVEIEPQGIELTTDCDGNALAAVESAVDLWRRASGKDIALSVVDSGPLDIACNEAPSGDGIEAHAWINNGEGILDVYPEARFPFIELHVTEIPDSLMRHAFAHELGHALSSQRGHHDGEGIMAGRISSQDEPPTCLSAADVDFLGVLPACYPNSAE